ncbi:MAG: HAMP domain-containing histidine kinase [Bacteroidetes bacterium]|nr:HAMP domain-containing histidine kinase [Bacteroidota bacterium]MCK4638706.1 HAMP domain-containing histidine kinase [Bacteroidales bacterium]
MNKKTVILIICLMAISLIGLMVIQVYWIKNAITVKEANFVRSVNDAVSNVVFRLEKIEMSNRLTRQITIHSQGQTILNSIDSINNVFFSDLQSIKNREDFEKFIQKSFLAQNALQELLDIKQDKPVEQRLSKALLDSLITFELKQKGINTQFEFGVFSPVRNSLIIQKTGIYPNDLLNKSFVFTLFPSDMQMNPDYLMIYFPNQKRFIISQMWGLLLISAIFIIIIILSFIFTITTIFRQKKLSELKSDLINNMTHEFKTPISTISLACEALIDKDIKKSETVYNNYINIINEENKRLEGMAEKILQSATLEKGQLVLKKEWINVHKVILDAIKNINLQVEKKNGNIYTDLRAETCIIDGDKVHITNVIYNLLDNANKYTLENPEILISTRNVNSGIKISIQDNGIGISKANQKKIFEKLYRVPSGNIHNFSGFGLGLSYVKAVVEKHSGTITLESEIKYGTKFNIFLPVKNNKS